MYEPAEANSEKSKPLITEKVENDSEQTGVFVKPDSLEIPAGMELVGALLSYHFDDFKHFVFTPFRIT